MLSINIHFFILFLAFGFVESFGPIYFYKIGMSLPEIALYWAFFFIIRVLARPLIIHLCHCFSIKSVFYTAIILFSGRYFFYSCVDAPGPLIVGLLLYEAITSTAYWIIYHAYFAVLASSEKAGVQVATRDMMLLLARLVSPVLMSLFLEDLGFEATFVIATIVSVLSIAPLLTQPMRDMHTRDFSWKKAHAVDKSGAFIYCVTAIHEYSHLFFWRIALYFYLTGYVKFGAFLSLAIFFQIIGNFLVGKYFDRSSSNKPAMIGLGITGVVITCRAFLPTSIALIVTLDALFVLGSILHGPYISAINYRRSKKSGSTLLFQFWSETGWDIGCILTLLSAWALLSFGTPLKDIILIGLIGLVGMQWMIRRYRKIESLSA